MLFFFIALLIVLAVVGTDAPAKKMSRDSLLYHLYTGQVKNVTASVDGASYDIILNDAENSKHTVSVPDIRMDYHEISGLLSKSAESQSAISIDTFIKDVEEGTIRPLKGYPLRVSDSENNQINQRLFAEYFTKEGSVYSEIDSNTINDSAIDMVRISKLFADYEAPIAEAVYISLPDGIITKAPSGWSNFFFSFGPILLFILLFYFLFVRQAKGQGGMMGFPKSRATTYTKESSTGVTFNDVAGIEEAKEEVEEITEFLKNPTKFTALGGRIPRGVMLVGPPGTGKTLLAKAIAGEANVPFISISGSDFVEMFVGVGASRVRDLFEQARKESPCIIFLDEIDAVGRKRGTGTGGGNDEREQTLNAILVEMDGFASDERIIVIAATNRADVLDSALLRPGRFDRQVTVDLPDVKGREAILNVHAKPITLSPDTNLSDIAKGTPGFSGAELAALMNEAAIMAAMNNRRWVLQSDLEECRDKVRFGRQKKSHAMDEKDLRETAIHEAGHAVVSYFLEHTDPVHKITIIPRGQALGATFFLPEKDHYNWSRKQLCDEICALFGGYAAEAPFLNDTSAGVSNDLERATKMAHAMVRRFGMSNIGPVHLEPHANEWGFGDKYYSEHTAKRIDEEVNQILLEQNERASQLVREHMDLVEKLTEALLKYETLTRKEFEALMEGGEVESLRPNKSNSVSEAEGALSENPPPIPEDEKSGNSSE